MSNDMNSANSMARGSMPPNLVSTTHFTQTKLQEYLWNLHKTLLVPGTYITSQSKITHTHSFFGDLLDRRLKMLRSYTRYPFNIIQGGKPSHPFAHLDIRSFVGRDESREQARFETYEPLPLIAGAIPPFSITLDAKFPHHHPSSFSLCYEPFPTKQLLDMFPAELFLTKS